MSDDSDSLLMARLLRLEKERNQFAELYFEYKDGLQEYHDRFLYYKQLLVDLSDYIPEYKELEKALKKDKNGLNKQMLEDIYMVKVYLKGKLDIENE